MSYFTTLKMEVNCSSEMSLYFCRTFVAYLLSVYLLAFHFYFEDGGGTLTNRRRTPSELHDVTSEQNVLRCTNESFVVERLV
jgi:hypothetical protein